MKARGLTRNVSPMIHFGALEEMMFRRKNALRHVPFDKRRSSKSCGETPHVLPPKEMVVTTVALQATKMLEAPLWDLRGDIR